MTDLLARAELTRLASELEIGEDALAFLADREAADLRALRTTISAGLFGRHEGQFRRLAALSGLVPAPMAAKIAKLGLGPVLAARVASVLEPEDAMKLAKHLDASFMAKLAPYLDPARVTDIVAGLSPKLVVDVGRRLMKAGEHATLGRFVALVDVDSALQVIEGAPGEDLLRITQFTEDFAVLDEVISRVGDDVLRPVLQAAVATEAYDDAVVLLGVLSAPSRAVLVRQMGILEVEGIAGFIAAFEEHRAWDLVTTALMDLDDATLRPLATALAAADPAALETVRAAAAQSDPGALARFETILAEANAS